MSWEFVFMAIVVVVGMAVAFVAGMYTEWLQGHDEISDALVKMFTDTVKKNDKAIKLNTDVLKAFTDAMRELAKEGDDNVGGD